MTEWRKQLDEAIIACEILFPADAGEIPFPGKELDPLLRAFRDQDPGAHLHTPVDAPDGIARLNAMIRRIPEGKTFAGLFDTAILDMLSKRFPRATPGSFQGAPEDSDGAFCFAHAKRLAVILQTLIPAILSEIRNKDDDKTLSRLLPSAVKLTTQGSMFLRLNGGALGLELRKRSGERDIFHSGRVFRHKDGEFRPLVLDSIRSVDAFYGYHDARKTFMDHFKQFAEGKSNLPLLISSLPGLGKTQMTIAHTLHYPELTLILPDAADISTGLESLLRSLEPHKDKKFVLFFDDIDASATDWYYFRANVGGAFNLPAHVTIVISSNQRFPANISSRGRGFVFPIFDEIRCQEMITDCLTGKGMKEPSRDLVSVIASDYVEEFGQKLFEELSPRTLVRYLSIYNSDVKKRRKMLENSRNELITEPDAQVFYDENVKLMRSIYGDSILDELRQREYNGGIS